MIQEGRVAVTLLLACWACEPCRELLQLFLTMLPHEMDYPIRPCKSLIRATRTFKIRSFLLGMPRCYMKCESLCMEELLLTGLTLKGKMTLVILHMIMHGVLILLNYLTYRTDIVSLCVFLIRVGHTFIVVSSKTQFFLWRRVPPPRFAFFWTTLDIRTGDPLPGLNDDEGIRAFKAFRNLCEGTDWLRRRVILGILKCCVEVKCTERGTSYNRPY